MGLWPVARRVDEMIRAIAAPWMGALGCTRNVCWPGTHEGAIIIANSIRLCGVLMTMVYDLLRRGLRRLIPGGMTGLVNLGVLCVYFYFYFYLF